MTSSDDSSPPDHVPGHVTRYLAGEATPADRADAERWLDAAPDRRVRFAELERLWRIAAALPSQARIDRMWQALEREVRGPAASPDHVAGESQS